MIWLRQFSDRLTKCGEAAGKEQAPWLETKWDHVKTRQLEFRGQITERRNLHTQRTEDLQREGRAHSANYWSSWCVKALHNGSIGKCWKDWKEQHKSAVTQGQTVQKGWSQQWRRISHRLRSVPVELFQILKDDAVKVLHSICQQMWKTQQCPQDWKRSVFIPVPKKGNAKECSDYCTIALISHASKVMLKIL